MATQISVGRLGTPQTLNVTGTSAASEPFGFTYRILVSATAACNVVIGNAPEATTADTVLPANFPLVLDVTPGEQLAAVGSGTISITELT